MTRRQFINIIDMKDKESYLELHKRLMKQGVRTIAGRVKCGLCCTRFNDEWLKFDNSFNDIFAGGETPNISRLQGHDMAFWGSGYKSPRLGEYTPLRQNIILLLAAVNGEL